MNAFADHGTDLAERTVLVLAAFDEGIEASLPPLLVALSDARARVAILSGLGDPRGDINPVLSLARLTAPLGEATGRAIIFIPDCVGAAAEAGLSRVAPGGIAILENLRFHRGETAGDRAFANRIALLGDFFLDARAGCQPSRAASVTALPTLLPNLHPAQFAGIKAFSTQGRP